MGQRAALLISCSKAESDEIHRQALIERRTFSGYVLKIVMDRVSFEEHFLEEGGGAGDLPGWARPNKIAGPRTAFMVRCSADESARVRAAAKRRYLTIAGYVRAGPTNMEMSLGVHVAYPRLKVSPFQLNVRSITNGWPVSSVTRRSDESHANAIFSTLLPHSA